ncbi:MAG TPA: 4-hydroxy-tetrahydrodipicolinate reductase [Caulobacteraceae bacterium]|nr:4-hydroxy-tetrahydrodipicolinate reductase [Caulobacteraceae bacterium]
MAQGSAVRIGVAGALGRMGRAVIAAVEASPVAELGSLCDLPEHAGQSVDGRPLTSAGAVLADSDVVVDFTTLAASAALARAAAERGGPALIIGATGEFPAEEAAIAAAAERIAIVRARSFSLGINILLGVVEQVAARLGPDDWDVEIFEAHHRRKVDAPSGTALMLGEAAARGRGVSLDEVADRVRDGLPGARTAGHIGFSVARGGGLVGEHSVSFIAEDESLVLAHSARDRSLFARGALAAAVWVEGKPPGRYDMQDVLGFARG